MSLLKDVCKPFYLATLGLKSDKMITTSLSKSGTTYKRGKHENHKKMPEEVLSQVRSHIYSFNPSISHYRQAHAPNRLYLAPELNISFMFNHFSEKYPSSNISYESYRRCIKKENISFTKLGKECESYDEYKQHMIEHHKSPPNDNSDECETCISHANHLKLANMGRKYYAIDRENKDDEDTTYLSSDMQKIIMLPRMPGVKTAIFQRRLTTYHQTFSPLGKGKKSL